MKKLITLLVALLITITSFAQTLGFNYKAVIKDNLGNIVANQTIGIKFIISEGIGQETIYEEEHHPTTDNNGILIVNIGEGNDLTGNFHTIDWGSNVHYLRTELDITGGSDFQYLGEATPFKTVPYALSAANVSGLEAISETNGIGWRLMGRDPEKYGNIGENAVDLSESENPGSFYGATGLNSFALGKKARASGNHSVAIGYGTIAEGEYSIALGVKNIVEPNALFTIGGGPTIGGTQNAMIIYQDGKSKFYEDMIINRRLTAEGLLVAKDGMVLTGELNRGGTEDMLPIAYGSVSSTGSIYAEGGNFTVTKDAVTNTYTITVLDASPDGIAELDHTNSSIIVTPFSGSFRTASISYSGNKVRVHIFDSSFGQVANSFQFVIYKL